MKYEIISDGEMRALPTMEKPTETKHLPTIEQMKYINAYEKHLASLPTYPHRLSNKVGDVVDENDFEWGWYVKTESYQGEGHHVFKTAKEAINKYSEWSKRNGNLQAFTHEPVIIAIPKEESFSEWKNKELEKEYLEMKAVFDDRDQLRVRVKELEHLETAALKLAAQNFKANLSPAPVDAEIDLSKVNRVEVIDANGRSYVCWKDKLTKVEISMQDSNRTMKIFITQ